MGRARVLGQRQRNQRPSKTRLSTNTPGMSSARAPASTAAQSPSPGGDPEPAPVQLGGQSRLPPQDPGGTKKRRPGARTSALLCPGNGWVPAGWE